MFRLRQSEIRTRFLNLLQVSLFVLEVVTKVYNSHFIDLGNKKEGTQIDGVYLILWSLWNLCLIGDSNCKQVFSIRFLLFADTSCQRDTNLAPINLSFYEEFLESTTHHTMNTTHLGMSDERILPFPRTNQVSYCCFAANSTELSISVSCTVLKFLIIATTMMMKNYVNIFIFLASKEEFWRTNYMFWFQHLDAPMMPHTLIFARGGRVEICATTYLCDLSVKTLAM